MSTVRLAPTNQSATKSSQFYCSLIRWSLALPFFPLLTSHSHNASSIISIRAPCHRVVNRRSGVEKNTPSRAVQQTSKNHTVRVRLQFYFNASQRTTARRPARPCNLSIPSITLLFRRGLSKKPNELHDRIYKSHNNQLIQILFAYGLALDVDSIM